jgi:hypothetical protein
MRKLSAAFVLTVLAIVAGVSPAAADTKFGIRGGYYTEVEEPFAGVEVLTHVGRRVYFNPNFEWIFVENANYFTLNGDFHYDFPVGRDVYVWAGAGLGWSSFDFEGPDNSDDDLVLNLLTGAGVNADGVIPYVQLKLIVPAQADRRGGHRVRRRGGPAVLITGWCASRKTASPAA